MCSARCILVVQLLCLRWSNRVRTVSAGDKRQTVGGSGAVVHRAIDLLQTLLQWIIRTHVRVILGAWVSSVRDQVMASVRSSVRVRVSCHSNVLATSLNVVIDY